MSPALRRSLELVFLGALPIVVAVAMFAAASSSGSLAADFHNELYPEAKQLLDWENPFPGPDYPLEEGTNQVWPPVAALVAPLTILPAAAADWTIAILGLAVAMLSLRIVGVRDWRVYGAFALWPAVIGEIRVSHLTAFLCLLIALAWRYREHAGAPGAAIGVAVAIKFFVWPVGVWLAAIGKAREALLAAAIAGASLLLVLPFTGLDEYVRTLLDLGRTFDQDSTSVFGFLAQIGVPDTAARVVALAFGLALIAESWRRASLGLAVAACLVLSPIVWLDYYAIAAVPLAIVRPRLAWAWLAPLATWGLLGAGIGSGDAWGSARVLIVFAIVFAVIVRGEREAARGAGNHAATVRPLANRRLEPRSSPD